MVPLPACAGPHDARQTHTALGHGATYTGLVPLVPGLGRSAVEHWHRLGTLVHNDFTARDGLAASRARQAAGLLAIVSLSMARNSGSFR